jgi:glutathione S-transferase
MRKAQEKIAFQDTDMTEQNETGSYTVYGGTLSYFTQKLLAAMKFYGAPHQFHRKSAEVREVVEARSGTHQVPVLLTPENWMVADTTPLLNMLDQRFPHRTMFPGGLDGLLVHVVEEYFDEWIARTMVHYRWHYEESARFCSRKMVSEGNPDLDDKTLEQLAANIANWGGRACRATGVYSDRQKEAAEEEYVRILEAVEKQLAQSPYLMGDKPCAVDCIVLGGLRAHTNHDPDPKKLMVSYPKTVAWCEQEADQWDGSGELAPFPDGTEFARFVLAEASRTYKPYVLGNADALIQGSKAFKAEIYAEEVSYLTRPYPELSRQMVINRTLNQVDRADRTRVDDWLAEIELSECFAR